MNIRMLKTMRGSPDGIQVFEYRAGQKYDLPDDLAQVFLREGWAEEDKELVLETKVEPQAEAPVEQIMKRGTVTLKVRKR
jgi:hypothetical protein